MPLLWRKGNNYLAMVSALLFLASCLCINSFTTVMLRRKRTGDMETSEERRKGRAERRLTLYALVSFLGQLLMAAYYVC